SATSLGFCALEGGEDYGINDAEFLFVCRDGKYELLVDTRGHVGRLRALEASKSAGLKCTETPFGDHQSKYECKPAGSADAKFATFDKTDFDHVRGIKWPPSVAASAQKDLVAKANARLGSARLAGVMSTNSKKCVVEAT